MDESMNKQTDHEFKDPKDLFFPQEVYTLILRHDYVFEDSVTKLDDPIIVKYVAPKFCGHIPTIEIVNEMLRKLEYYLFKQLEETE